jgi:hypothetical protein
MGGMGSGRHKTKERTLVEDCDYLDIGFISKYGMWFNSVFTEIEDIDGQKVLWIHYNTDLLGPRLHKKVYIEIDITSPHFGGERSWLKCPGCGKRVQKVYRPPLKIYFRCRTCHDLMYNSQESNCYDGWLRKTANGYGLSPKKFEKKVFG